MPTNEKSLEVSSVSSKSSVISRVAKLQNNSPTSVAKMNLARIPKPKGIQGYNKWVLDFNDGRRTPSPRRASGAPSEFYAVRTHTTIQLYLKRYEDIELAQKLFLPKISALAPLRIVENSLALKCAWIASKKNCLWATDLSNSCKHLQRDAGGTQASALSARKTRLESFVRK